jgi:hypothetical protein
VQSFTEVCALLRRLLTERPRFAAAARVLELQPRSKGLSLQGLLVTTVQRLPRYVLLLRELLQHATVPGVATLPSGSPPETARPEGEPGAAVASSTGTVHAVEAALEKLRDVTVLPYSRTRAPQRGPARCPLLPLLPRARGAGRGGGRVGDAERRQRAMAVARDVLKRDDLVAPSRAMLKEGSLTKLRRHKWASQCHRSARQVFLFSDLLVLHTEGQRARVLRTLIPPPSPTRTLARPRP